MISVDLREAVRRSETGVQEWDDQQTSRAIRRYERFLGLVAEDIRRPVAPTRDIDAVWHLHMLSPVAYHRDCMEMFGEILDHDGGFGKEKTELSELIAVFEDTAKRWEERYGEPYVENASHDAATKCWHDCKGRCWHECKGG